jgi:LysM repeat protein
MISPNRSHLGAAVAVSDQIYVVLETALQTSTGQNQSTAYGILTSIPVTQAACMGAATVNADGSISQYSIPVAVSTARLDGDVVHEVKYGQTLWSIAIQYNTTIEQIKRYNNLTTDAIAPGWKLLIQKEATQPAPSSPTLIYVQATQTQVYFPTPTNGIVPTETSGPDEMAAFEELGKNRIIVAALIVSFSVLVAGIVGFGRRRES